MKKLAYAGIMLGLMLVLSAGLVSYYPPASAKMSTAITIDEVPSKVRPGDKVTLTGSLTTAEGEPISQVPITVYLLTSDPRLVEATSGFTGLEGTYEVTWDVELIPTDRASFDVTKSVDTQVASLFAQFGGNDEFARSKTGLTTVTIEVNSVKTFVNFDKKLYREGEAATAFIGFLDLDDNFVDPDSISATFNGASISDLLDRKKVGSYTYVTPALQMGHNQITVIPHKEGFNIEVEVVTITVFTTGPAGPFLFE